MAVLAERRAGEIRSLELAEEPGIAKTSLLRRLADA